VRLLTGAPPPTLNNSHVARHQQNWRLHEYHLLLPEDLDSAAVKAALADPQYWPLSAGDPLRAYLPHGLAIQQDHNGIRVREPGHVVDTFYSRCPAPEDITPEYAKRVREILIVGEVSRPVASFLFNYLIIFIRLTNLCPLCYTIFYVLFFFRWFVARWNRVIRRGASLRL
jgi:hypothetical protein